MISTDEHTNCVMSFLYKPDGVEHVVLIENDETSFERNDSSSQSQVNGLPVKYIDCILQNFFYRILTNYCGIVKLLALQ